jgi:hypothetical protein
VRPAQSAHEPVLVTLRATRDVASLRRPALCKAIRETFFRPARAGLRVIHFSIQSDHLHLIVEAEGARAFSAGMRGLTTRLALAINRALGRHGRLWADRFHARALTSPREVRSALVYVLANAAKHLRLRSGIDPYSSAPAFDGYRDRQPDLCPCAESCAPRTWLLRVGWRRHGLLSMNERPAGCTG